MSAIQWLLAWFLFILLLLIAIRTKVGHTLAYYALWMLVFLLVVSHWQEIGDIFQAGGIGTNGTQ